MGLKLPVSSFMSFYLLYRILQDKNYTEMEINTMYNLCLKFYKITKSSNSSSSKEGGEKA